MTFEQCIITPRASANITTEADYQILASYLCEDELLIDSSADHVFFFYVLILESEGR